MFIALKNTRIGMRLGLGFGVMVLLLLAVGLFGLSRMAELKMRGEYLKTVGGLSSHIDVDSRDETGQLLQALRAMNDKLKDIVIRVHHATDTINTASGENGSAAPDDLRSGHRATATACRYRPHRQP